MTLSNVEWRPVPGFPGYEVSSDGRVRSWHMPSGRSRAAAPRELKQFVHAEGYLSVCLCRGGKKYTPRVHRLVAKAFLGDADGLHAAHINGSKTDNRIENLKLCSVAENNMDRFLHGTAPVGERHGCARLTEEEVSAIRSWTGSVASAARRFGISERHAHRIRAGAAWGHVARGSS